MNPEPGVRIMMLRNHVFSAAFAAAAVLMALSAGAQQDQELPHPTEPGPTVPKEWETEFEKFYETEEGDEFRKIWEAAQPDGPTETQYEGVAEEINEGPENGTSGKVWFKNRAKNFNWSTGV
jgi:hypothetical protein